MKYSTKMGSHRLVLRNVSRKCGSDLWLEDLARSPVKLSGSDGSVRGFALFNEEISVVNGP